MRKAHRHAELMKFAADHWHEVEYRCRLDSDDEWSEYAPITITAPAWDEDWEFEVRLIRRQAIQPRREVPAPETEAPEVRTPYYLVSTSSLGDIYYWENMPYEREWLAAGLIYLNREDRDARVKAMLELEGRE